MSAIAIENLNFSYFDHKIIDDLSFRVKRGERAVIIGENGSGKSTLLKLILKELKPESGKITLFGTDIDRVKEFSNIGYVPQTQVANQMAFPVTCLELVVQNLYRRFGFIKIPDKESKARAVEALKEMELEEYIDAPVSELSGGLKQRAMIARAIVNDPELLILDEPTAGIDEESKRNFAKLIDAMWKKKNISMVLVTHELDFIRENLKDCVIYRIKGGRMQHVGI